MRKTIIGLLTFKLTLFIGLGVFQMLNLPADKSAQESRVLGVNVPFESVLIRPDTPQNEESYNLAPCVNPNTAKITEFARKNNTIYGGFLNVKIACGVLPEYPKAARAVKASGDVVLDVLVNELGEITNASVQKGHPLLRQAALKAAYQTRTPPLLLGGQSVKMRGILTYQFDIERGTSLPRPLPTKNSAQQNNIR